MYVCMYACIHAYISKELRQFTYYREGASALRLAPVAYDQLAPPPAVPSPDWFLACHVKDVFERLPVLKASVTSTYGRILKIDSTKKVGFYG